MFKKAKKYIALFLLLVLSVVLVPKELIHSFSNHADTEDERCVPNAPVSIEHQHQHCEFLKLTVPHYFFEYKFFIISLSAKFNSYAEHLADKAIPLPSRQSFLRGPPIHFC